eukprot:3673226-Amphidinium_carterae.1
MASVLTTRDCKEHKPVQILATKQRSAKDTDLLFSLYFSSREETMLERSVAARIVHDFRRVFTSCSDRPSATCTASSIEKLRCCLGQIQETARKHFHAKSPFSQPTRHLSIIEMNCTNLEILSEWRWSPHRD